MQKIELKRCIITDKRSYYYYFWPKSTKPQARKLDYARTATTTG